MSIDQARSRQRQQQLRAIAPQSEAVYRIGDRIPETGSHQVIYPDGSIDLNGIKLYGAKHESGDRVLAQQRSDGAFLLSEANPQPAKPTAVSRFGDQRGYLQGRRFNLEEPQPLLARLVIVFDYRAAVIPVTSRLETQAKILELPEGSEIYTGTSILLDRWPRPPEQPWIVAESEPSSESLHRIIVDLDLLKKNIGRQYQIRLTAYWKDPEDRRDFLIKACKLGVYLIDRVEQEDSNSPAFGVPAGATIRQQQELDLDIQLELPAWITFPLIGENVATIEMSGNSFTLVPS